MHLRTLVLALLFVPCFLLEAEVGARFDTLTVAGTTYYRVKVTRISPSSITIFHSRGMTQVMLEDLSQDLQERFGFDPDRARKYEGEIEARNDAARKARVTAKAKQRKSSGSNDKVEEILGRFGSSPELTERIDLRPQFRGLELITKSQGRRPSCSVFAVVSALEFQNSKVNGEAEKLSEEYLIWATRRTLGQTQASLAFGPSPIDDHTSPGDADAGFNLLEVVQALRTYGIPLSDQMPNTYGKAMAKIPDPSQELIAKAKGRRKVYSYVEPVPVVETIDF